MYSGIFSLAITIITIIFVHKDNYFSSKSETLSHKSAIKVPQTEIAESNIKCKISKSS